MINVGISRAHNSSLALVEDGELILHIENERLSNIKYDNCPFSIIQKLPEYVKHVDNICLAGVTKTNPADSFSMYDAYSLAILTLNKSFMNHKTSIYDLWDKHHLMHSFCAFYNSGFDRALCIVKDGVGSEVFFNKDDKNYLGREGGTTTFILEYPSLYQLIDKLVVVDFECDMNLSPEIKVSNVPSEGTLFEYFADKFGFNVLESGKVMGMSAYGQENGYNFYDGNYPNKNIFKIDPNQNMGKFQSNLEIGKSFEDHADIAYALQTQSQNKVKEYILKMVEKTGCRKVCLSGGYFLNCVANYEYLKDLPNDIEIYIEPISSDAGTSIGAAKYIWHSKTGDRTIRKQKHIYYGLKHSYTKDSIISKLKDEIVSNVNYLDICKLLTEKNIVAIYQGQSESGPRALGNRSILYDPRIPNGKSIVNSVKNREWFRPFAGTILEEHAKDWFDLRGLNKSEFMMYAVDTLEHKKKYIPSILHVDGTCRIQTVSKEHNLHFYNLISCFFEMTGIPILFNTSFNLAGDCIVETIDDALKTIRNSNINYLYLPEFDILISKYK